MPQVVISYSHEDRKHVEHLAGGLREQNIEVWYDDRLTPNAPSWRDEIAENLLDCGHVIVLLSSNSVRSLEVQREIQFVEQYAGGAKKLLTVRVGPIKASPERSGLLLHLASNQHFWNEQDSLDPGLVGRVARFIQEGKTEAPNLVSLGADKGIRLHSEALKEETKKHLFDVGENDPVLVKAVHTAAVKWLEDGETNTLEEALDALKRRNCIPRETGQFTAFCSWVKILNWYHSEFGKLGLDWESIYTSLKKLASAVPGEFDTPEPLLKEFPELQATLRGVFCSNIAERLAAIHDGFYKFPQDKRPLKKDDYDNWFERHNHGACLSSKTLSSLGRCLDVPDLQNLDKTENFSADQVKEGIWGAYDPSTSTTSNLPEREFPPDQSELQKISTQLDKHDESKSVWTYLSGLSNSVLEKVDDEGLKSRLTDFAERVRISRDNASKIPGKDDVEKAITLWREGFDALLTVHELPTASNAGVDIRGTINEASERFHDAGIIFPAAKGHAGILCALEKTCGELCTPVTAKDVQDHLNVLAGRKEALEQVLNNLLVPYRESLTADAATTHADKTLDWFRRECERLECYRNLGGFLCQLGRMKLPEKIPENLDAYSIAVDNLEELLQRCGQFRDLTMRDDCPVDLQREGRVDLQGLTLQNCNSEPIPAVLDVAKRIEGLLSNLPVPWSSGCFSVTLLPPVSKAIAEITEMQKNAEAVCKAVDAFTSSRFEDLAEAVGTASGILAGTADRAKELVDCDKAKAWQKHVEAGLEKETADEWDKFLHLLEEVGNSLSSLVSQDQSSAIEEAVTRWKKERGEAVLAARERGCFVRIAEALSGLDPEKAKEILEERKVHEGTNEPGAIQAWEQPIQTLQSLKSQNTSEKAFELSATVTWNTETNMPPPVQALADETRRLEEQTRLLRSFEDEYAAAASPIPNDLKPSCQWVAGKKEQLSLAMERLEIYLQCRRKIDECLAMALEGNWPDACRNYRDFIEQSDSPPPAMHILNVFETGKEIEQTCGRKANEREKLRYLRGRQGNGDLVHPIMAPFRAMQESLAKEIEGPVLRRYAKLRSALSRDDTRVGHHAGFSLLGVLLAVPIQDPANFRTLRGELAAMPEELPVPEMEQQIQAFLEKAGPDRSALCALIGEPEMVLELWDRSQPAHNVAAAVYLQIQEAPESVSRKSRNALIGYCAVLAGDSDYRKALVECLNQGERTEGQSFVQRLGAELEELLGSELWGTVETPGSGAQIWRIECCAIQEIRSSHSGENGGFPHLVGPALGCVLGQHKALKKAFSGNAQVRPWFGPAAGARAMHRQGLSDGALQMLCDLRDSGEARNDYGFSRSALQHDWNLVAFEIQSHRLRGFRIPAAPADTEHSSAETFLDIFRECMRLVRSLESPNDAALLNKNLASHFRQFIHDLEEAESRSISTTGAGLRRQCVDGVYNHYQGTLEEKRLSESLREPFTGGLANLRRLRAEFYCDCGRFLMREWLNRYRDGRLEESIAKESFQRLFRELEAVSHTDPQYHYPYQVQAEARILYFLGFADRGMASEALQLLENMNTLATQYKWPGGIHPFIRKHMQVVSDLLALPDRIHGQSMDELNYMKGILHAKAR